MPSFTSYYVQTMAKRELAVARRPAGFYWIQTNAFDGWNYVAEFVEGAWLVPGQAVPVEDEDVYRIDEYRVQPPDERVATLVQHRRGV